ncbi:hypothetical protein GCM10009122_50010 [Fulvivirga kasyanovii]|uniref:DUF4440 domain-containing protein n=1 Tax=Fulvivirga kasyanovii TaxID=396812 RepID=A0ABW9RPV7_9BACT|nr:DUF4440 domain-containing protein [Fulvivirga kasyanovii]MTI26189.1 hypothetical protein [Fulvivirga kasyanovii]
MKVTLSLIALLLLNACAASVDKEGEVAKLLLSDELDRKAHMTGDAGLLVSRMADTLVSIQNGQISKASKAQIEEQFSQYFNQVKYRKWDNIAPPAIHISDDGKFASLTINKITETREADSPDSTYMTTTFAWTALYRKENDQWKMFSITSTRASQ